MDNLPFFCNRLGVQPDTWFTIDGIDKKMYFLILDDGTYIAEPISVTQGESDHILLDAIRKQTPVRVIDDYAPERHTTIDKIDWNMFEKFGFCVLSTDWDAVELFLEECVSRGYKIPSRFTLNKEMNGKYFSTDILDFLTDIPTDEYIVFWHYGYQNAINYLTFQLSDGLPENYVVLESDVNPYYKQHNE